MPCFKTGYIFLFFFFNDTATTEIYTSIDTLSLHDALPISYGLLTTAIRDPDPVLVFEHRGLYRVTGEVGDAETLVPLGSADVKRPGRSGTSVSASPTSPVTR